MGVLRVYLALSVLAAHAGGRLLPWQMHDGRQAVQIFYIISGFYMALVLASRYADSRDFYLTRALRIFPPYWVALALTFAMCLSSGLLNKQWFLIGPYINNPLSNNGMGGITLAAASNLSLVGQDWIMFLSHDSGHQLHFTENFRSDNNPLYRYLLIPQCWSVGVEVSFYVCAPYLNRLRSRWLALIAVSALMTRLLTYYYMQVAQDPWTYRFFPFEISLFILGMLAHRLYVRTTPHHPPQTLRCVSKISYTLSVPVILLLLYLQTRTVEYLGVYIGKETSILMSYSFWALFIPILFFAFGNQKVDRYIGELSYPIYLVHLTIIIFVKNILFHFGFTRGITIVAAFISVSVSIVFYRMLVVPLDRRRYNLTRGRANEVGSIAADPELR